MENVVFCMSVVVGFLAVVLIRIAARQGTKPPARLIWIAAAAVVVLEAVLLFVLLGGYIK